MRQNAKCGNLIIMGEQKNLTDSVKDLVDVDFWLQDTIVEAEKQLGLK